MKEIKLNVEGMVCTGCENRVKNVLSDIKGIEKVEANHENGTVYIETNSEVDMKEVKEAIENLGFDVKN